MEIFPPAVVGGFVCVHSPQVGGGETARGEMSHSDNHTPSELPWLARCFEEFIRLASACDMPATRCSLV